MTLFENWFGRFNPNSPNWDFQAERVHILKDIERHPLRPFAMGQEGFKKRGLQWARLKRIHEKIKIEEQRVHGYSTSPEFEKNYLDYVEASEAFRFQAISFQEYKRVSDTWLSFLARDGKQWQEKATAHRQEKMQSETTVSSSPPTPLTPLRCGYCQGAGFYYCQRCQGTGSIASELTPRYTGDPVTDGLIRATFEFQSICPKCNRKGEFTCYHCHGQGYIDR